MHEFIKSLKQNTYRNDRTRISEQFIALAETHSIIGFWEDPLSLGQVCSLPSICRRIGVHYIAQQHESNLSTEENPPIYYGCTPEVINVQRLRPDHR